MSNELTPDDLPDVAYGEMLERCRDAWEADKQRIAELEENEHKLKHELSKLRLANVTRLGQELDL